MTDQLDTMFRALGDAPEPIGLAGSADVRHRGDSRRRMALGMSVGLAVVMASVAVVGISAVVGHVDAEPEPPTTTQSPTGPEPTTTLADDPILSARELEPVAIYTTFPWSEHMDADHPLAIRCLGAPAGWGASDVQRFVFISNHIALDIPHARLVETVAQFPDPAAASDVLQRLRRGDGCGASGTGASANPTHSAQSSLPVGTDGGRRGLIDEDRSIELSYHELAFSRVGQVVVVLEWTSAGPPRTGTVATGWDWAVTDSQMAAALDRAVRQAG